MLIDNVLITIKAGNGGNGAVTFKRNAQTPKGGPDGGNGGKGGDVYFQGINDITALSIFQFKKALKAQDGVAGGKNNLYGKNAEDLIIKVPLGTYITDLKTNRIYEINNETDKLLLARGGRGGKGNREFRSSTNQTPRYAESGGRGEEKELQLELKLIADVGLIGLPNAGKSSLLSKLTNAHPKIGNYPFTTLEPNLGVMDGTVLADIPGLIEGSSQGKGLGIKFLKHIEKTKILLHCIDSTQDNLLETYNKIRNELGEYNKELLEKPEIILLTKTDLIDKNLLKEKIQVFKKAIMKVTGVSINNEDSLEELKSLILKS
ncbi:GTPase ObgE [Candidatus Microgenomates bacterium]|nr:MAG: GTPase ObgE [Candidatus Microgenomates bacterium]